MSAMETTFTVRTGTDNDAMEVPDGIETVVVNDSAERVIVPPGVQIIRLQTSDGRGGGGRARSRSPRHSRPRSRSRSRSPNKYGDMIDELMRAKREAAASAAQRPRAAAMSEKSLSLPSCPPTPPGSRSAGTDAPEFRAAARPPPQAAAHHDIFSDRTLEVGRTRVINQQPTTAATAPAPVPVPAPAPAPAPALAAVAVAAPAAAPVAAPTVQPAAASPTANGKVVRYASETEAEMRDPLVAGDGTKMRKLDSFGWREEFQRGEDEQKKPAIEKLGRAVADILCCWMGV